MLMEFYSTALGETSESACGREFSSFQALEAHRASHKKPRLLSQHSDQLVANDEFQQRYYNYEYQFPYGLATSVQSNSDQLPTSAGLLMGHGEWWCSHCNNYTKSTVRNNYFCQRCHQRLNSRSSAESLNNQECSSIDINDDGEPTIINSLLENRAKVPLQYEGSKVDDSSWATSPEMVLGVTSQAAISLMSFALTGSHSSPLLYAVAGFIGVGFCSALASRSLRRRNPEAARWFGKVGAAASASGFIAALGMFLPQNKIWTCVVTGVSCLIPAIAMALA